MFKHTNWYNHKYRDYYHLLDLFRNTGNVYSNPLLHELIHRIINIYEEKRTLFAFYKLIRSLV